MNLKVGKNGRKGAERDIGEKEKERQDVGIERKKSRKKKA